MELVGGIGGQGVLLILGKVQGWVIFGGSQLQQRLRMKKLKRGHSLIL